MGRVQNKIALVTGGAVGIGQAACLLLTSEGTKVASPYHASKGTVRLMTKTDALLYAKDGIRVNSIHPGFIWTPMVEGYLKSQGDSAKSREYLNSLHPLGHIGEPTDIAYGILYLASDESKFVTGSELVIDGGYTVR